MALCGSEVCATNHGTPRRAQGGSQGLSLTCATAGAHSVFLLLSLRAQLSCPSSGQLAKARQVPSTAPARVAGWLSPVLCVRRPGSSLQVC